MVLQCEGLHVIHLSITESTLQDHCSPQGQPRLSLSPNSKLPPLPAQFSFLPFLLYILLPKAFLNKQPSCPTVSDCILRNAIYGSLLVPCLNPCNGIAGSSSSRQIPLLPFFCSSHAEGQSSNTPNFCRSQDFHPWWVQNKVSFY